MPLFMVYVTFFIVIVTYCNIAVRNHFYLLFITSDTRGISNGSEMCTLLFPFVLFVIF